MDNQLTVTEAIDQTEERFKVVAPLMSFDKEKGFAVQLLQNSPYLMKAATSSPNSLMQAITNIAAIGLSLNPAEKLAYLLPRTVKDSEGKYVSKIFLEPSYMGLCKIATDSGSIKWVQAAMVYSDDSFTDNGPGEKPTHTYKAFDKDRGSVDGVYCVAKTEDGDYLTTVMTAAEIMNIKERSELGKTGKGPWGTDFKEMAKKSVVRQAFKLWPRSAGGAMDQAVHMSNENEGFEPIQTAPKFSSFTAEQKNYFDQLIEKGDGLAMFVFYGSFDLNADDGFSVWSSLFNSFEKGTKGKYGKIVNDLIKTGESIFLDCLTVIEEGLGIDDAAVLEAIEGFDGETIKLIESKLDNEMVMEFNKLLNKG